MVLYNGSQYHDEAIFSSGRTHFVRLKKKDFLNEVTVVRKNILDPFATDNTLIYGLVSENVAAMHLV